MKNQNATKKINKELMNKIVIGVISLILVISLIYVAIYFMNKNKREYQIEEISEFNYYTIKDNNKVGVIDTKGNQIIAPEYDGIKIPNPLKPVFICINNYNYETGEYDTKILNDKNEELFTEYEEVSCISLKILLQQFHMKNLY